MFEKLSDKNLAFILYPNNGGRWLTNRFYAIFASPDMMSTTENVLPPGEYTYDKNGKNRKLRTSDVPNIEVILPRDTEFMPHKLEVIETTTASTPQFPEIGTPENTPIEYVDEEYLQFGKDGEFVEDRGVFINKRHHEMIMSIYPDAEIWGVGKRMYPLYYRIPGISGTLPVPFDTVAMLIGFKYWDRI